MYSNLETPRKSFDKIYSISEISSLLKGVVENHFTGIKVKGELSSVKRHTSGHVYFALKDQNSVLDGICWRGVAGRLQVQPQDGLEVVCTGRLTTYPGRSKYQIVVESIELAGEGALLKLLEELKKKLAAEGLFAQDRKKPIPFLPQTIGIITSPTGAVIRDILHRLQDRFPRPVLLWPVSVQGKTAAQEVSQAIQGFNTLPIEGDLRRPDVIIVARGGGSLEDLWAFNEEIVVRATAESDIPIISAIGHETDTTLIDFAADYRAPTPTAAAEKGVPVRVDLVKTVEERFRRLDHSLRRMLEDQVLRLDDRTDQLQRAIMLFLKDRSQVLKQMIVRSPQDLLYRQDEKSNALYNRFVLVFQHFMKTKTQAFLHQAQLLEGYSYAQVLKRGFCLAKTPQGEVIRSAKTLKQNDPFALQFSDGEIQGQVLSYEGS